MKTLIFFLLLLNLNVSIAEQIETVDRNDLKDHQSEYFKQLEKEEVRLLGIIELNTDAGTKDRTLAALGILYSQKKAFKKAEYYLSQVGDSAKNNKNSPIVSASRYNLAMLYLHGKGEVEKRLVSVNSVTLQTSN